MPVTSACFDECDDVSAPRLSVLQTFLLFLSFGLRAFGGPVAQIALYKEELVIQKRWISIPRFNRVFAVYQMLPGGYCWVICCWLIARVWRFAHTWMAELCSHMAEKMPPCWRLRRCTLIPALAANLTAPKLRAEPGFGICCIHPAQ